jgi:hypothetical protein
MSRWLWALLGGVVLVAIAAVFWIASNKTSVTPPVSSGPAPVTPAPVPPAPPAPAPVAQQPAPSPAPAPTAQEAAPSPPPLPAPPAAQQAAAPPAPAPTSPPGPIPAPSPETPSAPPVVAQEPPPPPAPAAPLAEAPLPPPAPGRETPEVQGGYAPKSLAQLVGAWAYPVGDCNRLFERRGGGWAYRQPVDKFAQAAIVEPKRILLPSATCRIESASEAEGALKVSAECADSITYTSSSVMISLRSATELLYSASGDPVLATTLNKCAP